MNLDVIKLMPERQVFKVTNKSPIQVMTIKKAPGQSIVSSASSKTN